MLHLTHINFHVRGLSGSYWSAKGIYGIVAYNKWYIAKKPLTLIPVCLPVYLPARRVEG